MLVHGIVKKILEEKNQIILMGNNKKREEKNTYNSFYERTTFNVHNIIFSSF